uniref:Major facilitator superfamily (MFS) profile domain-containing protein n=1 Tax=Hucho hucho TaxID=62062 RepID=A0A4W5NG48_9TELE
MFSSHAVSNLSIFFCAEITPTVIRGGGLGLVLASAGFGMLTAPIMELHNQKGYFLHHIIFACCTLICIICILLLPETRYQPLPETLADGECYTRQPLLPPRKPGEQRLLLAQSESSRDYTRVHDTPLHETAATTVFTMDSTASSAVDFTAPSFIDILAPHATELTSFQPEPDPDSVPLVKKDLNGRSITPPSGTPMAALDKAGVVLPSKEHLLSSTPRNSALTPSSPLLKSTEDSTDIPLINYVAPASIFIVEDETAPSPTKDVTTATDIEDLPTSILVNIIPPVIETHSISSLDSTTPPVLDSSSTSTLDSTPPPVIETTPTLDSTIPPVIETPCTLGSTTPPVIVPIPPFPTPSPTVINDIVPLPPMTDCTTPIDSTDPITTDSIIPILIDSVDDKLPPPPTPNSDCTIPPVTDSVHTPELDSSCVNDVVVSPSSPVIAHSPVHHPTPLPPPPQPIDSVHIPTTVDSSTPPVIDTVHPLTVDSTTLPITDIVQPITLNSTTPLFIDSLLPNITDSETTEAAPASTIMDCTISSPIDSGILPVMDCAISENSAVNGVASS